MGIVLDSDLTTIAGLTATTDNFIVSVSSAWASRTPAQVRTTLGLVVGTDVQAYSSKLSAFSSLANGSGVLTNDGAGNYSWAATPGTGTVTSVSVTTANGVSGTVATSTTTPAITLTLGVITPTSVNGLTLSGSSTQVRSGVSITAGSSTTRNTAFGSTIQMGNTESTALGSTITIATNANSNVMTGSQLNNITALAAARLFCYGVNLQPGTASTFLAGTNIQTAASSANTIIINPSNTSLTTYTGGGFIGIGAITATGSVAGNVQIGDGSISQDGENHSIAIGQLATVYLDGTHGSAGGEQTCVGYKAKTGSWRAVSVGAYAQALAVSSNANGYGAYVTGQHSSSYGRGSYNITGATTVFYNGTTDECTYYLGGAYSTWTNPTIPETPDLTTSLNAGTRIMHITTNSGLDVKPTPTNTNVRGAHIQLEGGASTDTALGGEVRLATTPAGVTANNTLNAQVVMLTLKADYTFNYTEAVNNVFGTTTGTKHGTATTQKQAWWNATPIVQPTTAFAAATLVSNGGTALTSTDTFDGYTLLQVVKILRGLGLIA